VVGATSSEWGFLVRRNARHKAFISTPWSISAESSGSPVDKVAVAVDKVILKKLLLLQSPKYIMRLSKNKHINVKFLVRALTDMV